MSKRFVVAFVALCALPVPGAAQCEVVKLLPPGAGSSDEVGDSVDIEGERLVLGAPGDDDGGFNKGAVFVYRRDAQGTPHDPSDDLWTLEAKILASGTGTSTYARSLSLDGNRLLVGRPTITALDGYAEIWRRSDGGTPGDPGDDAWLLEDELPGPDSPLGDQFGEDVALSGDCALIGDPDDDTFENHCGTAWVFRRDDGGTPDDPFDDSWNDQVRLFGGQHADFGVFGTSLALQGPRALIGAHGEAAAGGEKAGAAYVFERDDQGTADPLDDTWSESARLVAADGDPFDHLGWDVALDGDVALLGAPVDDDLATDSGSAYVFRRDDGGTWVQVAKLYAPGGVADQRFGSSVALRGTTAVVGSWGTSAGGFIGRAFVFRDLGADEWIFAGDAQAVSFGTAAMRVATDGTNALLGAPADFALASQVGAAHVVALLQPPWSWADGDVGGVAGVPCLLGAGSLQPETPYSVSVHHGPPGAEAFLLLGASAVNAPFKGGVLVPQPDRLYPLVLDAAGGFSASEVWPAGAPAAPPLWLQAWVVDAAGPSGFSATNGLGLGEPPAP